MNNATFAMSRSFIDEYSHKLTIIILSTTVVHNLGIPPSRMTLLSNKSQKILAISLEQYPILEIIRKGNVL